MILKSGINSKNTVKDKFSISDIGHLNTILGLQIERTASALTINQSLLIKETLKRFEMIDCKPVKTPSEPNIVFNKNQSDQPGIAVHTYQSAIGSLNYISLGTRVDIQQATNSLSRYASNPSTEHWKAVKRIFRYLKGTLDMKLTYLKQESTNIDINVFTDANWAADLEDRRSCSGVIVKLGTDAITWYSKKQHSVSLSTAEAEFVAIGLAAQECIWFKTFMSELLNTKPNCSIFCDNQAAIFMSSEDTHKRAKHIDIKYHFIKENLEQSTFKILYIPSSEQQADILTKSTSPVIFQYLKEQIMSPKQ